MRIVKNSFLISILISCLLHAFIFIVNIRNSGENSIPIKTNNNLKSASIKIWYNEGKKNTWSRIENKKRLKNIDYQDTNENKENIIRDKNDRNMNKDPEINNESSITKAKPLENIIIEYPFKAKIAGVEGEVIIEIKINKEGIVEEYKIHKDLGFGCTEAVIEKIKKTRFDPAKIDGIPVDSIQTLKFNFRIIKE